MEDFRSAFNDADTVYVTPVYPAGEAPIDGIDAAALVTGLKQRGHRAAMETSGPDDLVTRLAETLQQGDTVICLGRSAAHTSALQSLMRSSYTVFCLTKTLIDE